MGRVPSTEGLCREARCPLLIMMGADQVGSHHIDEHRIYALGMPWTPYADLDELVEELLGHWRRILGDGLAGAWIQGSFALGAGDLCSDCDWIVATHAPLTGEQVAALRGLH